MRLVSLERKDDLLDNAPKKTAMVQVNRLVHIVRVKDRSVFRA